METPATVAVSTSKAALNCRLCGLSFDTVKEQRQHAKSDEHVYKLRCRVASLDPASTVPAPPNKNETETYTFRPYKQWKSRAKSTEIDEESSDEETTDEELESDTSSDKDIIEFVPEGCLFCNQTSKDFDDSLLHMHQAHSLVVPFQSSLAVDLQTLVWYLHMVIFSYRECICCGKRRQAIEAVQQHMTSAGHCRFNVTEDMSEFYNMESLRQQASEARNHPDEHTLRLPSGKLLGHRSYVEPTPKNSRLRETTSAGSSPLPASHRTPHTGSSRALVGTDGKEDALPAQLAQLRIGDQLSLMHLPQSQQRSLLLARKKELDQAKRAERRKRGKVDHVGNKTTIHTKYYKQEVPIYSGG